MKQTYAIHFVFYSAQTLSQSVQLMKEFNNNENPKFKPNTPVIVNKIIEQTVS